LSTFKFFEIFAQAKISVLVARNGKNANFRHFDPFPGSRVFEAKIAKIDRKIRLKFILFSPLACGEVRFTEIDWP
jgi:hypothetical protein